MSPVAEVVFQPIQYAQLVFATIFLAGGAIFSLIGGFGICRFSEFYSRLHAAGITDTMGAGLVLLGLIVLSGLSLVTFKLAVIGFFLMVASPSSCHALANAALASGVEPEMDVEHEYSPSKEEMASRKINVGGIPEEKS